MRAGPASPASSPTGSGPGTAAVVVAWHEPELTRTALASILAMQPTVDRLYCVVQQWSSEDLEGLRTMLSSKGVVLAHDDNLGYAACANEGIEAAVAGGAGYVLVVNNDATVTPHCLARLLEEASRLPRAAAIGPAIAFADQPARLWYAGGSVSRRFAFTTHRRLRRDVGRLPPSGDTGYVPGCCVLVQAAAWRQVGPYRADYFLYYEDAEWCLRARRLGWRCRYLGEVLCYHAVSATAGRRGELGLSETAAYYLARNPLRFALESRPPLLRASRLFGVLVIWGLYNLARIARTRSAKVAAAYLDGTRDAISGRMGRRAAPRQ